MAPATPPRADAGDDDAYAYPQTPEPMRARMQNLQRQVDELVRKSHAADRKHRADLGALEQTAQRQRDAATVAAERADDERARADALARDMERCRVEGEGMRDELNLYSSIQQNKALLALAHEQMQMIELEQRLVAAEAARVMRDHKLALFQAREDEQAAEVAERDARIDGLEAELARANTSLSHRLAAETKARAELAGARAGADGDAAARAGEVERLEATVRALRAKEKEARAELEQWLKEEKGRGGSGDKEKAELKAALRAARAEREAEADARGDAADELAAVKEAARERERALKARLREAEAARGARAGSEDDAPAARPPTKARADAAAAAPSLKKAKARAATPESDGDSDVPAVKEKRPLASSDADNKKKAAAKRKSPEPAPAKPAAKARAAEPEKEDAAPKKKTRKLLNAAPAFTWDPIMNSGDGVIPAFLSPVRPTGKSVGTIPRAGFGSLASRRF